jgi:flagellin
MSLTVNTNVSSLMAQTTLGKTSRAMAGSFERLSSGLRVSKAADDAAGLAVAENLDTTARSARVAMRNVNDGVSVISTAEGATNEVGNIVKRMRELAVQSSSETLADSERAYIQDEYTELAAEVDRIAGATEFNGTSLTDGTTTSMNVQVGVNGTANDQIGVTLGNLSATVLGVDTGSLDLSTATGAQSALSAIDTAVDTISGYRSDYGAVQNRLGSALNNLETYHTNLKSAESSIRDADFAYETAELTKNQVMQQAGVSVLAQAKGMSSSALSLL